MATTYTRLYGAFNESYINEVDIDGSSCSFEFTFSGTIQSSGAATNFKIANIVGSGSLLASGAVSYSKIKHIIGTGLLQASGTGLFKEIIYVTGSGTLHTSGSGDHHKHHVVTGSGLITVIGNTTIVVITQVQVMHTDRTLYVPEDIREVWVDYDEERTLEIATEYREIDVPAEATYYS